jgi:ABC-type microcin C transport system duplicated ATPase subunit YejF
MKQLQDNNFIVMLFIDKDLAVVAQNLSDYIKKYENNCI